MKGKRGMAAEQVALLLIASLVVVLIALALLGVFGPIDELLGRASDLEIAVQACNGFAQANLKTSYCSEFYDVKFPGASEKEWVNCEYLNTKNPLENTLGETCIGNPEKSFCDNLKKGKTGTALEKAEKTIVNGETCLVILQELGPTS